MYAARATTLCRYKGWQDGSFPCECDHQYPEEIALAYGDEPWCLACMVGGPPWVCWCPGSAIRSFIALKGQVLHYKNEQNKTKKKPQWMTENCNLFELMASLLVFAFWCFLKGFLLQKSSVPCTNTSLLISDIMVQHSVFAAFFLSTLFHRKLSWMKQAAAK